MVMDFIEGKCEKNNVEIWKVVIILGQDFGIWPSTTPFVCMPILTQFMDMAVEGRILF